MRSALLDITHGTLRRYGRSQAVVRALSNRQRTDPQVEALLWCALYALECGRYAEYTVVDQAVKACRLLQQWNAGSYVNALLRAFLRGKAALETRLATDEEARFQHPHWWIDLLRNAYPAHWQSVLEAGNTRAPMCLRVNLRRVSMAAYAHRLEAAGIPGRPLSKTAYLLRTPLPVARLPGFDAGEVSVQDAGAQRAATCLELTSGQRVLDACAAPGGKTAHILEAADVDVTALDADPLRCDRVARNLQRLGLHAAIRAADCTLTDSWWDGVPYDRILADVPCSGSGIARRHPDVKWLRRMSDVARFAQRQGEILDALWRVLRPGGKLLYVTCSVFPGENEETVSAFLARTPGARRMPEADGAGAQWLPAAEHDGFFYALIAKPS